MALVKSIEINVATGERTEIMCTPEEETAIIAAQEAYAAAALLPVVPKTVTMRQARLALLAAGKLDTVSAAIASLPSPDKEEAQIEWEYSQTVERGRRFVAMLAPALGLDSAALDQLFITAATL